MADILKLKKKAADFEAKKQMDRALATYREMIEVYESGEEDPVDIPLYNRVGDLLQKAGNLPEAVAVWERAVDHYTEGGFYNPAIALCNKILRQSPGRTVVYYKLGKITAEKGFKADARENFLEYAGRMQKAGNLDEAFRALKEFADLVPDQDDVRLMLAEQLLKAGRKTEAVDQLQISYALLMQDGREDDAGGIAAKMKEIDPSVEPKAEETTASNRAGDLVFLDLGSPAGRRSTRATPVSEVKRAAKATEGLDLLEFGLDVPAAPGKDMAKATAASAAQAEPTEPVTTPTPAADDLLIEPTALAPDVVPAASRSSLPGLEPTVVGNADDVPEVESLLDAAPEAPSAPIDDLVMLDDFSSAEAPVAPVEGLIDLDPIVEAAPAREPITEPEPEPVAEAQSEPEPEPTPEPTPEPEGKPPETMFIDIESSDFGSFGEIEPFTKPGNDEQAFELLDVETSEASQAQPFGDAELDDALSEVSTFDAPSVLPTRPETPVPAAAAAPVAAPAAEPDAEPAAEIIEGPSARTTSVAIAHSADSLREQVEAVPEDPGLRRQYAEALLDGGDREGGIAELEISLAGYESAGDLDTAASIAEEIVRLAPKVIRHHQKRVEFAFRANDRRRLAEAYVELADALMHDAQAAKARVVYQRVLDIAPDDLRAQAALEAIADVPPAEPTPPPRRSTSAVRPAAKKAAPPRKSSDDEFISLGDWLREEEEPKSTRMVVEEKEPTGDEQADFNDMLRKFKQGIADNVDDEDHAAHYDLGIAYKEMGLIDEAISEFQIALRGTSERARTFEALGHCFVEKGQLPVAATILQRALNEPGVGDESLIGVLYLLGAIGEELQQFAEARKFYQRVFAVDIQFRDVGERLNTVEQRLK